MTYRLINLNLFVNFELEIGKKEYVEEKRNNMCSHSLTLSLFETVLRLVWQSSLWPELDIVNCAAKKGQLSFISSISSIKTGWVKRESSVNIGICYEFSLS